MNAKLPNRWVRHTVAGLARTVLAIIAGLVIWTILPALLGWQSTVVLSGSMEPTIRVGDVVVAREVPADALRPGHVVLVEDPARPDHLLLHRYDHAGDDGSLVLRGDANSQPDSTPVEPDDVRGVGILRVPWVGMLHAWAAEGRFVPLGLTVLGLAALVALSPVREREPQRPSTGDPGDGGPDEPGDQTFAPPTSSQTAARQAAVVGVALVLVLAGAYGARPVPVSAAFTDTVSTSATFSTGTWSSSAVAPPGD